MYITVVWILKMYDLIFPFFYTLSCNKSQFGSMEAIGGVLNLLYYVLTYKSNELIYRKFQGEFFLLHKSIYKQLI